MNWSISEDVKRAAQQVWMVLVSTLNVPNFWDFLPSFPEPEDDDNSIAVLWRQLAWCFVVAGESRRFLATKGERDETNILQRWATETAALIPPPEALSLGAGFLAAFDATRLADSAFALTEGYKVDPRITLDSDDSGQIAMLGAALDAREHCAAFLAILPDGSELQRKVRQLVEMSFLGMDASVSNYALFGVLSEFRQARRQALALGDPRSEAPWYARFSHDIRGLDEAQLTAIEQHAVETADKDTLAQVITERALRKMDWASAPKPPSGVPSVHTRFESFRKAVETVVEYGLTEQEAAVALDSARRTPRAEELGLSLDSPAALLWDVARRDFVAHVEHGAAIRLSLLDDPGNNDQILEITKMPPPRSATLDLIERQPDWSRSELVGACEAVATALRVSSQKATSQEHVDALIASFDGHSELGATPWNALAFAFAAHLGDLEYGLKVLAVGLLAAQREASVRMPRMSAIWSSAVRDLVREDSGSSMSGRWAKPATETT